MCPITGQRWWCLLPTVSTAALATFAQAMGLDVTHRAVLAWDGAGWHTSGKLVVPDGSDLLPLPLASPDRQPVERVWPRIDAQVANRVVADLDALEAVLVDRCRVLTADPATIRAHTVDPATIRAHTRFRRWTKAVAIGIAE